MAEKNTDKKEKLGPQSGKRRENGDESLIPRSASILIMLISAAVALGAIAMLQTQSNEPEAEQRDERTEEKTMPAPPASEKRLFPVSPTDRRFTVDELRAHGPTASTIYLAIFGRVYDVTKGKQHYGKKGGYSFFAGRDATRSFVSGDFTDAGLSDDLTGLSPDLMLGIEDWVRTYEKDYAYVGILVGRFYDANGRATEALRDAERRIGDGHAARAKENDLKRLFPPCNSRWAAGSGEVWCTTKSGGIARDWVGVPRRFFQAGRKESRCACVKKSGKRSDGSDSGGNRGDLDDPRLKLYTDCPVSADTCKIVD